MAAVKRIADINQKNATNCLNCSYKMPTAKMTNDTDFACPSCGFYHYITRTDSKLILTASTKESRILKTRAKTKSTKETIERFKENMAAVESVDWEIAAKTLAKGVCGLCLYNEELQQFIENIKSLNVKVAIKELMKQSS